VNVVPDACFTLRVLNTWCDDDVSISDVNELCTIPQRLNCIILPIQQGFLSKLTRVNPQASEGLASAVSAAN
jgi:hypothetical protein